GGMNGSMNFPGEVCVVDYATTPCTSPLPSCAATLRSPMAKDDFGATVAMAENLLVVGAPKQSTSPFFTYKYEAQTSSWLPVLDALPIEQASDEPWGTSLALDGTLLAVGSVRDTFAGKVRIYSLHDDKWTLVTSLSDREVVQSDAAQL